MLRPNVKPVALALAGVFTRLDPSTASQYCHCGEATITVVGSKDYYI